MAKVGGSTVRPGGGITQEGLDALLEEPTADLRERTPQAEPLAGSVLDQQLLDEPQVGAPIEQAAAETVQNLPYEEEQVAASQIPDLKTRAAEADQRVDRYQPIATPPSDRQVARQQQLEATHGPNGGLNRRAANLVKKVEMGEIGITAIDKPVTQFGKETTINPIVSQIGALNQEGKNFSPQFLGVLSYITEDFFAEKSGGKETLGTEVDPTVADIEEIDPTGKNRIKKGEGSEQLGRRIADDWGKYQRAQGGQPSAEPLGKEQATVLGDMAKELYFRANKDSGLIQFLPGKDGEAGAFMITQVGNEAFEAGKNERRKYFPKEHVRPTKTPTKSGQQVGDKKAVTKKVTGKIKNGTTRLNEGDINQAAKNFNKVPNVVNKQRMRVLFSTILPVLSATPDQFVGPNADPMLQMFAEINNFGQSKFDSFQAKAATSTEPDYNPLNEINNLRTTIAQSIYGIARERNGANYLTYDIQAFNGRLSPQQTHFNPTTSKAVRFVTSNAVPVRIGRGSRQDRNIRQMYSMMLVKGADALLPDGREAELQVATPQLLAWGRRLKDAVQMTDAEAEALAAAIEQGMPVNDPNFPQVKGLALDPEADAELINTIKSKGEDGPHFIDGLIDFVDYTEALEAGRPHYSYFNAYIDGKTNGIASNGIQMGDEGIALRTGVTRDADSPYAVDQDKDIRAELGEFMQIMLADTVAGATEANGFDGQFDEGQVANLNIIANELYSNKGPSRNLHKKMTMTFGYGKEIDSFTDDILETMQEIAVNNPVVAQAMADLTDNPRELAQIFNGKYTEGMYTVMSPKGIEATKLLKAAALAHGMMDELMTMTSHTGMELRFGGNVFTDEAASTQGYSFEGDKGRITVRHYEEGRGTAAAPKTRSNVNPDTGEVEVTQDYGGRAWGGAVPGPVQSLDAATVAMTVTGKSWDRLVKNSGGNPYIHSIYDAFKMDANGYDVVLEEVNNNWLNAAAQWSYLEQTRDSLKNAQKAFQAKLKGREKERINIKQEFPVLAQLIELSPSANGNLVPKDLYRKLGTMLPKDYDVQVRVDEISDAMRSLGVNIWDGPEVMTGAQIEAFYNKLFFETDLAPRLNKLIKQTNKDKAELVKKIKRSGPVLQYYAH